MALGYQFLFKKVAIIGVGLIGGSLGKALKKHKMVKEICGVSRRKEALIEGVKDQAIDYGTQDIQKAVVNADLVVLATPVNVLASMFESIAPFVRRGCIVTDVGSTKVSIVNTAHEALQTPSMFVGSHPLAGSEKRGVEYASAELFEGSTCIMTPVAETHRAAVDRVRRMWTGIGAQVKIMSPGEHDEILAYISHLPHIIAYNLISSIPENHLALAAQGLKDTTRVASSSPEVWSEICLANSRNIIKVLDEFVGNLSLLRKAVSEGDEKALIAELTKAKTKRDKIA
ncbi:MAG: prephenate dehydrogenase/arogenate dehydrogenase family protein [Candidatus Omnitrophota bacterium]